MVWTFNTFRIWRKINILNKLLLKFDLTIFKEEVEYMFFFFLITLTLLHLKKKKKSLAYVIYIPFPISLYWNVSVSNWSFSALSPSQPNYSFWPFIFSGHYCFWSLQVLYVGWFSNPPLQKKRKERKMRNIYGTLLI